MSPEETEGQLLYDLGNWQWDIPELKELFQGILPKNIEISNFRLSMNLQYSDERFYL